MKKLVSLFMVCAIVLGLGAPLSAATDMEKPPLSEQSDAEILAFLEEYNIERFGQFADISDEQLVLYVRHVIGVIEERGEYVTTAGAWEFWEMDEAIENATKQYYSLQSLPYTYILNGARIASLTDSTLFNYTSDMINYNCYAYALGKTDKPYHPGSFLTGTEEGTINCRTMDSKEVAEIVRDDLKSSSLNMKCVKLTITRPTISALSRGQSVICVRMGKGFKAHSTDTYDYHFMKFFPNENVWRHKPGASGVLTYNRQPNSSIDWTNESMTIEFGEPYIKYTGIIYYIIYKSTHYTTSSGTYTGNNYHSGNRHYCEYAYTCADCGEIAYTEWRSYACSGNPCILPQSIGEEYVEA